MLLYEQIYVATWRNSSTRFLVQLTARDSQIQDYVAHKYFEILTNTFHYMNKYMLQPGQTAWFPLLMHTFKFSLLPWKLKLKMTGEALLGNHGHHSHHGLPLPLWSSWSLLSSRSSGSSLEIYEARQATVLTEWLVLQVYAKPLLDFQPAHL